MKILVANIGSTSFKFRLFDLDGAAERELASGGVDRIGGTAGAMTFAVGGTGVSGITAVSRSTGVSPVSPMAGPAVPPQPGKAVPRPCLCADHGQAIKACLAEMIRTVVLRDGRDLTAVAFKAVMAGDAPPVVFVDEKVMAAMEYYAPVAPAHNPAYVAAMRSFRAALGEAIPLVAAFEPGFHRTIPPRRRGYAVPRQWQEKLGIRRYGYHGASHRYVSQRVAELMGPPKARRVISCHLGGSSSICAVRDGASVATSMGFSPQSGLPQSKRVGEFDPFALALVARETGMGLEAMLKELGEAGGLAAMSGTSGDMRDILAAADAGDERARLTLDAFATAVRDYIGAYLVELGGTDALVFTGGIGENSPALRTAICKDLDFAGIGLDETKNAAARGEARIESAKSRSAVWVMPTNEELIVARQAAELLKGAT